MSESERVSIEAAVACMGLRKGQRVLDVELTDQIRGALDGGKVFRIDAPAPEDDGAVGEPGSGEGSDTDGTVDLPIGSSLRKATDALRATAAQDASTIPAAPTDLADGHGTPAGDD